MTFNNPNIELVNDIVYTTSGLNLSIRSEDIICSKNLILTLIKGRNPVENLQKMTAL